METKKSNVKTHRKHSRSRSHSRTHKERSKHRNHYSRRSGNRSSESSHRHRRSRERRSRKRESHRQRARDETQRRRSRRSSVEKAETDSNKKECRKEEEKLHVEEETTKNVMNFIQDEEQKKSIEILIPENPLATVVEQPLQIEAIWNDLRKNQEPVDMEIEEEPDPSVPEENTYNDAYEEKKTREIPEDEGVIGMTVEEIKEDQKEDSPIGTFIANNKAVENVTEEVKKLNTEEEIALRQQRLKMVELEREKIEEEKHPVEKPVEVVKDPLEVDEKSKCNNKIA